MLRFEKREDCYRVIQTIFGWRKDRVTTVDFSFDLMQKRCNNDPWSPTVQAGREWFEKYYRHHFQRKTS